MSLEPLRLWHDVFKLWGFPAGHLLTPMTSPHTEGTDLRAGRGQVSWQVRLSIKAGQLTNFQVLTGEMVQSTRTERGALSYQRFISSDCQFIHIYERYSDSAAALTHLIVFRERFGARFATMVEREEFLVYGHPSAELRNALDNFGAQYLVPFGQFEYWA